MDYLAGLFTAIWCLFCIHPEGFGRLFARAATAYDAKRKELAP